MKTTLTTLLPCLALLACAGGTENGNGNGNGNNGGDLGSVLDRISRSAPDSCETFETSEGLTCRGIAGAERFWGVDLTLRDDDTISGRFYVVLFANDAERENPKWRDGPGADAESCIVAAAITGTVEPDTGPCGACATAVSYSLNGYDPSLTTCPQEYVDELPLRFSDAFWGFELLSDGTAVGWDTERRAFPNGVHDGNAIQVWTNGACEWYGTGECT